jgi:N-acyl-D-amino-acid deacylase
VLDLLITGGFVLDGTGAPAVRADLGVAGGRIIEVGRLAGARAARVIRADGRVVSPGFIDMHAHDDFNLPVNPLASEKTRQGVTTLVTGNCGLSPAPLGREHPQAVLDAVDTLDSGLDYDWPTFGDFLDRMPPLGLNAATLVGHGTVRTAVLGDESRAPRADELARMAALVGEAMAAGAFGLSTGLFGPPSGYAETDEIVVLARVAARYGGGYHTHMRDEGVHIAEAVREALEIGASAGCPVQISHLKISSLDHWGRADELLATIEDARRRGVRVACDQYPYSASSGGLRHHLPAWVHEGGLHALLGRLRNPESRARLRYDLLEGMAKAGISLRFYRWDLTRVSESPTRPDYAGLTLAEIGAREGKAPVDALLDLLLADGGRTGGIYFHIDEGDVRAIMRDPHVGVGSDGLYTGRPGRPERGRPHPRHFGTFPRVLGRYVRDESILALPEAIRKMTSLSADVLGLADRGRIRAGAAADLVVFDPAAVTDRATFETPHQPPAGIAAVVVNGVPVVLAGEPTGATPGRVLRRMRPDAGTVGSSAPSR